MSSSIDTKRGRQTGRLSLHSSMVVVGDEVFVLHEYNESTWFNLTGFVQPVTAVEMCNSKDDDGLMDRQLFACPNEIHYDDDEYYRSLCNELTLM